MSDLPITFSAPMVRAILASQKTQTRRVVSWRGVNAGLNVGFSALRAFGYAQGWVLESPSRTSSEWRCRPTPCPFGQPGDRLWLREAFRFPESLDDLSPRAVGEKAMAAGYGSAWCPTQYEADGTRRHAQEWRDFVTPPMPNEPGRLRNARHMPRWASRITLEITGIRVERLQDISHADAMAEGMALDDAIYDYSRLWESLNGAGSWDANPWVWALEFRRVEGGAA